MSSARDSPAAASGLTHLLVLDFEATCQQRGKDYFQQEIIEFPILIYDLKTNSVTATFHEYVRPTLNPGLTKFCKDLTGIQQAAVDNADPFPDVWARSFEFLSAHGFTQSTQSNFAFFTCGDWDLKTMLPNQLSLCNLRSDERFRRWLNLKHEFPKCFPEQRSIRGGMLYYLNTLGLELEGRHHSGIDDCRNIARIVSGMRGTGWTPRPRRFARGTTDSEP